MSEQPEVVMPVPGVPVPDDGPITVEATWHHAPATGAYEIPEVTTVRAYEKGEDGVLVAKVVEPPARPTRKAGPVAEVKAAVKAPAPPAKAATPPAAESA